MAVARQVRSVLVSLLEKEDWITEDLMRELPLKWEKHGDLVLVPEKTFATANVWLEHPEILASTCELLRCNRLARKIGPTQNDDYRSPKVQLLVGKSTWVTKKENGILYSWDLCKCMFSGGNITEKQRIANWDLRGKCVVDMYAGIGYFALTYLVHSKADFLYACEWNSAAVEALENNLKLNKVPPEKYSIVAGDNRLMCPKNVADHVNLGLIPSSEAGWATACAALKKDIGGVLHVHGNVDMKPRKTENNEIMPEAKRLTDGSMDWSKEACGRIADLFKNLYPNQSWDVSVLTVVKVKSYAPHVDHVVADILCKPIT